MSPLEILGFVIIGILALVAIYVAGYLLVRAFGQRTNTATGTCNTPLAGPPPNVAAAAAAGQLIGADPGRILKTNGGSIWPDGTVFFPNVVYQDNLAHDTAAKIAQMCKDADVNSTIGSIISAKTHDPKVSSATASAVAQKKQTEEKSAGSNYPPVEVNLNQSGWIMGNNVEAPLSPMMAEKAVKPQIIRGGEPTPAATSVYRRPDSQQKADQYKRPDRNRDYYFDLLLNGARQNNWFLFKGLKGFTNSLASRIETKELTLEQAMNLLKNECDSHRPSDPTISTVPSTPAAPPEQQQEEIKIEAAEIAAELKEEAAPAAPEAPVVTPPEIEPLALAADDVAKSSKKIDDPMKDYEKRPKADQEKRKSKE